MGMPQVFQHLLYPFGPDLEDAQSRNACQVIARAQMEKFDKHGGETEVIKTLT